MLRLLTDGSFRGSTLGPACANDFRGAAYATSEVVVDAEGGRSWDRGYDPGGRQVRGAEKGPYVFRRRDPPAPQDGSPQSTQAAQ